ncbi:hypothetical protein K461DRAFT_280931 [Myriangium duriaei CBS 260.36]|uniref:Uncharacterized protein n=1 Tax=Myriangium duriaei CBS 260.36 TaxID=1168546 RepID=A0A9P4MF78_9PEZI|nr:hypothetical protein K461DRAFT_280931 [Myriangium duriaei CBS 260.36]
MVASHSERNTSTYLILGQGTNFEIYKLAKRSEYEEQHLKDRSISTGPFRILDEKERPAMLTLNIALITLLSSLVSSLLVRPSIQ